MAGFNGLGLGLGNLSRLSDARTRSISPENFSGEPGRGGMATEGTGANAARELGRGWKISPSVQILPGQTFVLAEIEGQGVIQSMWCTGRNLGRDAILRIYWDNQAQPSVECPLRDFFAAGWGPFAQLTSVAVANNPNNGLNCFWEMPFRASARITLENRGPETSVCYYQINYALTDVPADAAYFHAQFRRTNPVPYRSVVTLLDGVRSMGHYVGTYLAVGVTNSGWWGEGEIKFFLDGDAEFPTICGTGTEDYFGGAYDWDVDGQYVTYTTPFLGMHQVMRPDGLYHSQTRFSMYRWHIPDPIRFQRDVRVTLQALGWRSGGRYLPLQCDIASVAYWYQALPTAAFPELADRDSLEII
ncbi:MAG TPA: glycoside hydrolase family 172 protein [Chloroflexota bacterium]|nr:glycoside hydrolase family 172 protein [Chloroflexota bacterium]